MRNSTPEDVDVSAERCSGDLEDCRFLGVALVFGCAIGEVAERACPVFRDLGIHVLFLDGRVVFGHLLCVLVFCFIFLFEENINTRCMSICVIRSYSLVWLGLFDPIQKLVFELPLVLV
jgi:hypothetical protein